MSISLPDGATIVSVDDSATAALDFPTGEQLHDHKNLHIDTKAPVGGETIMYCARDSESQSSFDTLMIPQCQYPTNENLDGSGDTKWYVRKMLYSSGILANWIDRDDSRAIDLGFKVLDSHPGSCTYENTVNDNPTVAVSDRISGGYAWIGADYVSIYHQANNGQYVCLYIADKSANVRYQLLAVRGEDKTKPELTISAVDTDSQVTVEATDLESGIAGIHYYRPNNSGRLCDHLMHYDLSVTIPSGSKVTVFQNEKICVLARNNIIDSDMGTDWYALSSATGSRSRPEIEISTTQVSDSGSLKATYNHPTSTMTYVVYDNKASCGDPADTVTTYSSGDSISLTSSLENKYICFKAVDGTDTTLVTYKSSEQISLTRAPTINFITADVGYSDPKQEITVTASSLASDLGTTPAWIHKVIDDSDTCNATAMASGTTTGSSVTLSAEADNDKKVCFAVTDTSNNTGYAASGVITGIDRTDPVINVSSVVNNQVSATVTETNLSSFEYQLLTSTICDSSLTSGFNTYTPGTTLTLTLGQKACFKATDTAGNTGYATSTTAADTTAPTITVTPANNDSSPKQTITISATSTATDLPAIPIWQHKVIDDSDTCNATAMASGTTTGSSVTLSAEADNDKKVCFAVTDTSNNTGYAASGVITGIDRTDPVITSISGDKIDQAYSQGETIEIVVTLSEAFTDINEPSQLTLSLNSGGIAAYRGSTSLSSSPGQNTQLAFNYTVRGGDNAADLNVTAFNFNGDSVTDLAGNSLDATLPAGSNLADSSNAIIDTTAPRIAVSTISHLGGSASVRATVIETNLSSFEYQLPATATCNSNNTNSFSSYTAQSVLTLAANQTVCFKATDTAGNTAYAASIDTTPPTITVTPSSDDSSPKQEITVSASSSVPDLPATPVWIHKVIAEADACDSTEMASGTTSGSSVILTSEAYNNHKVCFAVTDISNNTGYQASGVISGIDTTTPVIIVSSVVNNQVSATVTETNLNSFEYQLLSSGNCDATTASTFTSYSSGTAIPLSLGESACFKATDTAGNSDYATSTIGTDITPPTITVTPSSDDSSPKTAIKVVGSSRDADIDSTSWRHKLLTPTDACAATQMTAGLSLGNSPTLDREAYNNHKVCFAVTDISNNTGYQASGVISGIDTTTPVIIVSSVVNNQVSATVTETNLNSFEYQLLSSGNCDATTASTFTSYSSGTAIPLSLGESACFKATDTAGNSDYATSTIGTDITPPTITVTPSSDDSSPKTAIKVVGSSRDADIDSTSWRHKLLTPTDACAATQMTAGLSLGNSPTLDREAYNNHKVCFAVTDISNNTGYQASGVISGIDTTTPVIIVSSVVNNQVSATVTETNLNSFEYQLLSSGNCDSSITSGFGTYLAGTVLTIEAGQKACFKASDTAGNLAYAVSGIGAADTTAPTISVSDGSLTDSFQPAATQPSQTDQPQPESPREPSQISDLSDDEAGNNASVWTVTIVSIIAISITAAITRKPKTRR